MEGGRGGMKGEEEEWREEGKEEGEKGRIP